MSGDDLWKVFIWIQASAQPEDNSRLLAERAGDEVLLLQGCCYYKGPGPRPEPDTVQMMYTGSGMQVSRHADITCTLSLRRFLPLQHMHACARCFLPSQHCLHDKQYVHDAHPARLFCGARRVIVDDDMHNMSRTDMAWMPVRAAEGTRVTLLDEQRARCEVRQEQAGEHAVQAQTPRCESQHLHPRGHARRASCHCVASTWLHHTTVLRSWLTL